MIMNKILQVKAINMEMGINGFLVLDFLRTRMYRNTFKASEVQNEYPLFLTKSTDVKDGLRKIHSIGLVNVISWDNGMFVLSYNNEKLIEFFKDEDIKIKKEVKKKTTTEISLSPEEEDVINEYKKYETLPQFRVITQSKVNNLRLAMNGYGVEDIKDAIKYASEQTWVANKITESWCNFEWIMKRLPDFMIGGKYRNEIKKKVETTKDDSMKVFL